MPYVRPENAALRCDPPLLTSGRRLREVASQRLSRQETQYLFDDGDIITWHRVYDFQMRSLACIAEQLLLASPAYEHKTAVALHVDRCLAWAEPRFIPPMQIYVSPHNPMAVDVAEELCEAYAPEVQSVYSRNDATVASNARWLLFLSPTCYDGEGGERLVSELQAALQDGEKPILVYAPEDVEFRQIIESTPPSLLAAKLYGNLAVEWRSGALHGVSMRLVARALGAKMGHGWCEWMGLGLGACASRLQHQVMNSAIGARIASRDSGLPLADAERRSRGRRSKDPSNLTQGSDRRTSDAEGRVAMSVELTVMRRDPL